MRLTIERSGQGADVVLLHGWSMNTQVWQTLVAMLSIDFTVHNVSLPGHGGSQWQMGVLEVDAMVSALAENLPLQAHYVGWSLGGLYALTLAAQQPQQVASLSLLATTPRFVQTAGWPCAVDATVFDLFAENLITDQADTLKRFLALQARGAKQSREIVHTLQAQVTAVPPPQADALAAGLQVLMNTDLRTKLADITCPTQWLLGTRDNLIPSEMLARLPAHMSSTLIPGAGHAPFISHATECAAAISGFIHKEMLNG